MSQQRPAVTVWRDPDDPTRLIGAAKGESGNWLSRITRMGPAFDTPAPTMPVAPATAGSTTEEVEALKRDIAQRKQQGDTEGLRALALAEYARPDGGRLGVKRALAAAGVSKPD